MADPLRLSALQLRRTQCLNRSQHALLASVSESRETRELTNHEGRSASTKADKACSPASENNAKRAIVEPRKTQSPIERAEPYSRAPAKDAMPSTIMQRLPA